MKPWLADQLTGVIFCICGLIFAPIALWVLPLVHKLLFAQLSNFLSADTALKSEAGGFTLIVVLIISIFTKVICRIFGIPGSSIILNRKSD